MTPREKSLMRNKCQRARFSLDAYRLPNNKGKSNSSLISSLFGEELSGVESVYKVHRFELRKQDFAKGLGTCILYLRSYGEA